MVRAPVEIQLGEAISNNVANPQATSERDSRERDRSRREA